MLNQELVQETIQDIQEVKDKILKRHEGDTTFTLRVDTVFNSLINSLGNSTGNIIPAQQKSSFTPQPLTNVAGRKINETSEPLKLPTLEVDKAESFKNEIKVIHDGFVDRENIDLLDSLNETQFRGVAKIAGVEDYATDPIDGGFIKKIKDKILANAADKTNRANLKTELNKDPKKVDDKTKNAPIVKTPETPAK